MDSNESVLIAPTAVPLVGPGVTAGIGLRAAPMVIGPNTEPRQRRSVVVTPTPVIEVTPKPAITVQPEVAEVIKPPPRGAWDERGWTRRQEGRLAIYEGFYQVTDRRSHE